MSEMHWFVTLDTVVAHEWLDFIQDLQDQEQVLYS